MYDFKTTDRMFYAAVCRGCRKVLASCHDDITAKTIVAGEVRRFVREGCIVYWCDVEFVRQNFGSCEGDKLPQQMDMFDGKVVRR